MADSNPDANLDEDDLLSSGGSEIDFSTEEGRARLDRRQAVHQRAIRRIMEKYEAERGIKTPAVAFEIPEALYVKAETQNNQLTDAERALLRSRGDLVGRALADPDTLTIEEAYRVMLWPAPEIVRANVQRVTGGRVNDAAELFAEAKAGRIWTVAECGLVMGKFMAGEPPEWRRGLVPDTAMRHAAFLVFARRFSPEGEHALLAPSLVGKDMLAVMKAGTTPLGPEIPPTRESFLAKLPQEPEPAPEPDAPSDFMPIWYPRPHFFDRRGNPALYSEDKIMPNLAQPIPPLGLFRDEYRAAHGAETPFEDIANRWNELSEEQQAEYAHHARAINQAAQDEFRKKLSEGWRTRYIYPDPKGLDVKDKRKNDMADTPSVAEWPSLTYRASQVPKRAKRDHPPIPPALYVKAGNYQDQLTPEERALLLSRGDLVGKALGQADSLTPEEVHELLDMPPPDVVRARIQHASGGQLSTVDELYAKAKMHPPSQGRFGVGLKIAERDLLWRMFRTDEESRALNSATWEADPAPGAELAVNMVILRLGWHLQVDPVSWPPTCKRPSPMKFYMQDAKIPGVDVFPEWDALPEDLKEGYRTRSEKFRIEAWTRYETALAEGTSSHRLFTEEEEGSLLESRGQQGGSTWFWSGLISEGSYVTTGLKLFGDELLADPRAKNVRTTRSIFPEVKGVWDALPDAERAEYEVKAAESNAAIRAGYWARASSALARAEAAYAEGRTFYP